MRPQKTFLQILFPKARAEIFRLLFGSKRRPRYLREIVGDSALAVRTIQDELRILSVAGLVTSRSDGFHRFFAANMAHPVFREIQRIAEISERLPTYKRSAVIRRSQAGNRSPAIKKIRMRPNREPHWGIFSKRDS